MAKSSPDSTKRRKVHYSRGNKFLLIMGGIVVASLLYLVVAPLVQRQVLTWQLNGDAKTAYTENVAASDRQHEQKLRQLQGVMQNAPVYSAIYNSCYTDENDAGWFATSHNYNCYISYADFFETDASDGFVIRHKYSFEEKSTYHRLETGEYPRAIEAILPADKFVPGYEAELYMTHGSVDEDVHSATDSTLLTMGVVAYAKDAAYDNRKLIRESGSRTLDPRKTYVVFAMQKDYMHRNIGCAIGGVIFCNSPLGEQ